MDQNQNTKPDMTSESRSDAGTEKKAPTVGRDPRKKEKEKQRRKRQMQIRRTVLILMGMIIVVLAGIFAIIRIQQSKNLDLSFSYADNHGVTASTSSDYMRAASFASDLCVGSDDIQLSGVSLSENEKSCLMDLDSGEVLFSQSMYEKAYPASITKIMTAILAIKYGDMDDVVTVSETAVDLEEGSQVIGLEAGDQVTLDELFHGLLVYSGNDAAMAIAEYIGGSVDAFVEMMNEEAKALGATNTNFVNPSGLHDDNHYTTAYDIYLMLNEALNYEYFVDVMQLSYYTMSWTRGGTTVSLYMDSTDQYLTGLSNAPTGVTVLGGKTGTTSDAGSCLAILTQNEYGAPYISVILKATTKADLYEDMNELLANINS